MLTVTRSRVKEKCGIADTSRDTTIDNLILEFVPVIEATFSSDFLDTPSSGALATMNLGATEVICGELLAQIGREVGELEAVDLGGLRLTPPNVRLDDPSGLIARGWARLVPYQRSAGVRGGPSTVIVSGVSS